MNNKKLLIGILILVILGGIGFIKYNQYKQKQNISNFIEKEQAAEPITF